MNTVIFYNKDNGEKLFEIGGIKSWEEQDRYGNIIKYRNVPHHVIKYGDLIIEFDGYCLKNNRNKIEIQPVGTVSIEKI